MCTWWQLTLWKGQSSEEDKRKTKGAVHDGTCRQASGFLSSHNRFVALLSCHQVHCAFNVHTIVLRCDGLHVTINSMIERRVLCFADIR